MSQPTRVLRQPLRGAPSEGRSAASYGHAVAALEANAPVAEVVRHLAEGARATDGRSPFVLSEPETAAPRATWTRLARVLADDAVRRAESGDAEGAVDALLDGLQVAADLARGGALLGRFLGGSAVATLATTVHKLLPALGAPARARLQQGLKALRVAPLTEAVLEEALGTEIMLARALVPTFRAPPGASELDPTTAADLASQSPIAATVLWIQYRALMAELAAAARSPDQLEAALETLLGREGRFALLFGGSDLQKSLRRAQLLDTRLAELSRDLAAVAP